MKVNASKTATSPSCKTLYSSYFETIIIEQFLKVQHLFSIKNLILFCPKNEKIEKRYEFNFIFEL